MAGFKNDTMFSKKADIGKTPSTGKPELSVEESKDSQSVKSQIRNNSQEPNSDALLEIVTGSSSAGNPQISWAVEGVNKYTAGIHNADFDKWKLCLGSNLAFNENIVSTVNGEITFPRTPAFLAFLSSSDPNVTGGTEIYVLGSSNAVIEVYDQNSDFDVTTGTFTAPITGRYHFSGFFTAENITEETTLGEISITTSNANYKGLTLTLTKINESAPDTASLSFSTYADMDGGDISNLQLMIIGEEEENGTITINGDSRNTTFSGCLVC